MEIDLAISKGDSRRSDHRGVSGRTGELPAMTTLSANTNINYKTSNQMGAGQSYPKNQMLTNSMQANGSSNRMTNGPARH